MSYIYFFRSHPDPLALSEGYTEVHVWSAPAWDGRFHRDVYGYAVFNRSLSHAELEQYDLIPDPRNHLAAVRKG